MSRGSGWWEPPRFLRFVGRRASVAASRYDVPPEKRLRIAERHTLFWTRTAGADSRPAVIARENRADALEDLGRIDESLLMRREILEARLAHLGPGHVSTLRAQGILANRLALTGHDEEARRLAGPVLAALRSMDAPDPGTVEFTRKLARSIDDLDRRDGP